MLSRQAHSSMIIAFPAYAAQLEAGDSLENGAALVPAHQRTRRLGTQRIAHQTDAEDLVPARRACLVALLVLADAGIVNQDGAPPECPGGNALRRKARF